MTFYNDVLLLESRNGFISILWLLLNGLIVDLKWLAQLLLVRFKGKKLGYNWRSQKGRIVKFGRSWDTCVCMLWNFTVFGLDLFSSGICPLGLCVR